MGFGCSGLVGDYIRQYVGCSVRGTFGSPLVHGGGSVRVSCCWIVVRCGKGSLSEFMGVHKWSVGVSIDTVFEGGPYPSRWVDQETGSFKGGYIH